ncbi:MAG: hypothetical protein ACOY3N_08995 [Bradyrhizobium sp.]|uniref:hypothetical protein n=1 Tax=Bradyrhizobium sp. TaxID=376 RepID=UPI003BEF9314
MSSTSLAHSVDVAEHADQPRRTDHHVARFRPPELLRLMAIRYGRAISDDEAGRRFRDRVLDAFALCGSEGRRRADNFLVLRCRWMPPAERAIAIDEAFHSQRLWSAEALGNDLDVTEAERKAARIRTFRAAGATDETMLARKKAADIARKQAKRDAARLHPAPRPNKSAQRLEAILKLLAKPGDWVCIKALTVELVRRKAIHFVTLSGPTLISAVHDAVKLGLETGQIEKRLVDGPKFKVAEICRSRR